MDFSRKKLLDLDRVLCNLEDHKEETFKRLRESGNNGSPCLSMVEEVFDSFPWLLHLVEDLHIESERRWEDNCKIRRDCKEGLKYYAEKRQHSSWPVLCKLKKEHELAKEAIGYLVSSDLDNYNDCFKKLCKAVEETEREMNKR